MNDDEKLAAWMEVRAAIDGNRHLDAFKRVRELVAVDAHRGSHAVMRNALPCMFDLRELSEISCTAMFPPSPLLEPQEDPDQ